MRDFLLKKLHLTRSTIRAFFNPQPPTAMKIIIDRIAQNETQTEGFLRLLTDDETTRFHCKTLELPWRNNERDVSCIPAGRYQALRHISPRFGNSVWIQGVPGRTEILIHYGNFYRNTLGCILVGRDFSDIDGDGHLDVTFSRPTMNRLYDYCSNSVEVVVRNRFETKDRPEISNPERLRDSSPLIG